MDNCRLCKVNKADKKGSHIVPHFLLKRIENVEGKTERDYELGFSIGEFETESHFGRAVLPEKLEEVFGGVSDEEIANNKHPLIVDYLFCSSCEKKLSVIESEYSKIFDKKEVSSEIGLLFWMSVIWRMSINKESGVELSSGENEISRRILNRYLKDKINDIDIDNMRIAKDLKKVSYKIIRCPEYSDKSITYLVFHPDYRNPYSILIDEFVVLFSFKNNFDQYKQKGFLGFKDDVSKIETNGINSGKEKVYTISKESLDGICKAMIEHLKGKRLNNINNFFNKVHVELGGEGKFMPNELKNEIMDELTSNEKKQGRKFTIEDLRNSTYKVMQKYGK